MVCLSILAAVDTATLVANMGQQHCNANDRISANHYWCWTAVRAAGVFWQYQHGMLSNCRGGTAITETNKINLVPFGHRLLSLCILCGIL
jgi:hypothetical protein